MNTRDDRKMPPVDLHGIIRVLSIGRRPLHVPGCPATFLFHIFVFVNDVYSTRVADLQLQLSRPLAKQQMTEGGP